ncbi:ATP-binding protein [Streptacidiphilus monticola]|jgi:anti-sigma regulatory factor (Ser/Thr protein kinase)|uniref:ATP-binding protein n=1 Tax=Streptacidiphilus monticola TaxID=2161674 RepID=A0ABW1G6A5_9ACTN
MIASESVRSAAAEAPPGRPRPGPGPAACCLPAVPASVPRLRRFARATAARWGLPDGVQDPLALVVTELAANAVRHSGSPDVALLLSTDGFTVTVEVRDTGRWRVASPAGEPDQACGGRGLPLVRAFAADWTLWRTPGGTLAVAELVVLPDR